jgi:hypothetical protein
MLRPAGARWDFDLGRDTRIIFIRQDNLNKMSAGFFPILGRVASPGDIVVVNSGLHYNNDYEGAALTYMVAFAWAVAMPTSRWHVGGLGLQLPKQVYYCCR